jgi:hypothetical protein
MNPIHPTACSCGCCGAARHTLTAGSLSRRDFLVGMSTAAVGSLAFSALAAGTAASATGALHRLPARKSLRLQPVLAYETPQRRDATSWRNWGAIQTEAQATEEVQRIERELTQLRQKADFPIDLRPVIKVRTPEEAARVAREDHQGVLLYAAGGWVNTLEAATDPKKWNLMFLRHQSGPRLSLV